MKNFTRIIILLLFTYTATGSSRSDSMIVKRLLLAIASEQVISTGEYKAGCIPAYRDCAGIPHHYRPDNNIFFTAITIFTLRNLIPLLSTEDKKIAVSIIDRAQAAFPFYRNTQGMPFYDFWPAGNKILPHTLFIRYLNKMLAMGEDADDAAMILLATDAADSTCRILRKRMIKVSNAAISTINSTYARYRGLPAYSTYLGLHMSPDFDQAVQCNILYFILEKKLIPCKQDSATIYLIADLMKHRDYLRHPVFIAPYYARPPVLMYHLARLMGRFRIPELEAYRESLVQDLQTALNTTGSLLDQVIISTSLLKLGIRPDRFIPVDKLIAESNSRKFVFFQARAAFGYPAPLKKIFLHVPYLRYNFYSPAYNKVLILEYLLEMDKLRSKN